jgi:hypothetical protein
MMGIYILVLLCVQIFLMLANYDKYSDRTELFVAKLVAQRQTQQFKTILNELNNGILIAQSVENDGLSLKYNNSKVMSLFNLLSDQIDLTDQHEFFNFKTFDNFMATCKSNDTSEN